MSNLSPRMTTPAAFTENPYPQSTLVKGIKWLTEPHIFPGSDGDTWSCTWAEDDHLYASGDDNTGVKRSNNSNLAFFRVDGMAPDHQLKVINPMSAYGKMCEYDGADTWKANGLICIDNVLYMSVSQHSGAEDYADLVQRSYDSSIIKSTDHGVTWSPKRRLPMFPSARFATPFFVQFGKNYEGALDDFVYAISSTSWNNGNALTLGRVRRDLLPNLDSFDWEMFDGLNQAGLPTWQPWRPEVRRFNKPIFKFRNFTSMTGMHYVPAIKRFLLPEWAYVDLDGKEPWKQTFFHLYEAPNPWGPWSLIHVEENFGNAWYNPSLPSKWFEEGGLKMWMVCGGDFASKHTSNRADYSFCTRKFELLLK